MAKRKTKFRKEIMAELGFRTSSTVEEHALVEVNKIIKDLKRDGGTFNVKVNLYVPFSTMKHIFYNISLS